MAEANHRSRPSLFEMGASKVHVGTAALGCPAERSSATYRTKIPCGVEKHRSRGYPRPDSRGRLSPRKCWSKGCDMPNTGERREIARRVNANEAEVVRESTKLVSRTRQLSVMAEAKSKTRLAETRKKPAGARLSKTK
jgi:hypothetical protein